MTSLRLALLAALSSLSLTAARAEEIPPLPAEPVGVEPETTPGLRSDRPRPETRVRSPEPEAAPGAASTSEVSTSSDRSIPASPENVVSPVSTDDPAGQTSGEPVTPPSNEPQPSSFTESSAASSDPVVTEAPPALAPTSETQAAPETQTHASTGTRKEKLSFALGGQTMSSSLWDRFVEMDTQQGVWDVGPKNKTQRNFFFLTAEYDFDTEGSADFAGIARLHLPRRLETTGTPQGQAAAKKTSSLWGFEIGPLYRFYPSKNSDGFFVDGSLRLGFLMAHQKLEGGRSGELTASALTYTAEVAAGYRFLPQSSVRPFVRGGYSFSGSGKFSVNQASGSAYSDFRSGDRVAVRRSTGYEDLSVSRSGAFVTVGLTWMLGEAEARPDPSSIGVDTGTSGIEGTKERAIEAPSTSESSVTSPDSSSKPDTEASPQKPSVAPETPASAPAEPQFAPVPEAEIRDPLKAEPVDPNWIPEPLPSPASPSSESSPKKSGEYPATTPDADVAPQKVDFTEWY